MDAAPPGSIDAFALAVVESVEEAIVNALFAGETMAGNGGAVVHGLPQKRAAEIVREWNACPAHSSVRP